MIRHSGTTKALTIARALSRGLDSSWKEREDVIIVVGGDGYLLDCIRTFGLEPLYIPINGGTLGFLLNDFENITDVIEDIKAEDWNISEFETLYAEIIINSDPKSGFTDRAVNEVCIERSSSQTTRLDVIVDRAVIAEDLAADGLIVSTALGSTGYNFSAGGAICHAGIKARMITPICAHHPRIPPIVVPTDSPVRISANQIDKRPIKVTVDGREYRDVKYVTVSSDGTLKMAYFRGHNFTRQLVEKILKR